MTTENKTNILATHNAWINCIAANNTNWIDKHEENIINILLGVLPHGSGIDCKWNIDLQSLYIICNNSYHRMNENGCYCGYIDFSVRIKTNYRDIFGKIIFSIVGKFGRHQDLKDYLYEIIGYALENL